MVVANFEILQIRPQYIYVWDTGKLSVLLNSGPLVEPTQTISVGLRMSPVELLACKCAMWLLKSLCCKSSLFSPGAPAAPSHWAVCRRYDLTGSSVQVRSAWIYVCNASPSDTVNMFYHQFSSVANCSRSGTVDWKGRLPLCQMISCLPHIIDR